MAGLGYNGLPLDALIRLRDHGVDPDYVRRLEQRGVGHLGVDAIIERRDRGSDDPAVTARELAESFRWRWQRFTAWLQL